METKICCRCGTEKPLSEFLKKKASKDGLTAYCAECHRKECLNWIKNNRDKFKQNKLKQKEKCRNLFNNLKKQGCIVCGESDIACIDFHHLDNKIETVSNLFKKGSCNKALKETEKCVTLCANCHRKLHFHKLTLTQLMQQSMQNIVV